MKHIALSIFTTLLLIPAAFASSHTQSTIDIKVNGMVCDFCAQSIWKVFKEHEEVEDIKVDLDTGIVTILLKDGETLSDEALNKGITYAGYELVSIEKHEVSTDE